MTVDTIKIEDFRNMIQAGQKALESQVEYVNSLNVFPVPDGDTGTNMNMTFTNGNNSIKNEDYSTIGDLAGAFAKGLLMGARGNSGVILSQLFRGFTQSLADIEDEMNGRDLAQAFEAGVDSAYKAVMKPVEGTILTVARKAAEAGSEAAEDTDDATQVMEAVIQGGQVALDNTPNQLPQLKEVGVVDSGGQGLMYIYRGFLAALNGEVVDVTVEDTVDNVNVMELAHQQDHIDVSSAVNTEDIVYGYCTEMMIALGQGSTVVEEFDLETFRNHLDGMGDSLLAIADDEVAKVHIHTEHPGEVFNYGQRFGELLMLKSDNMREQHRELKRQAGHQGQVKKAEPSKYAVIAVASGKGLEETFKNTGVTHVIQGGQTMNPSTEDFVAVMEELNAENFILLPNNGNIQMAAEQAASLVDQPSVVIPTKNLSQGLTAMLAFDETADLEENKDEMTAELDYVVNGQITYAIRDTEVSGLTIKKDDYMGLVDGDIKVAGQDIQDVTVRTVAEMVTEDHEIITIFTGEGTDEDTTAAIVDQLEEDFSDFEVEVYRGDQPVYSYIISVE